MRATQYNSYFAKLIVRNIKKRKKFNILENRLDIKKHIQME